MNHYTQLKEFERVRIYEGLKRGLSLKMIGDEIGRDKSSVSREISRNSDQFGYLYPRDAQKRTDMRKARHGSKINRNPALKAYVMEGVKEKWSPSVIAGRWSLEHPEQSLCAEAIYQFAYHDQNKHLMLWAQFFRAKKKRGHIRKSPKPVGGIPHRISVHNRPAEIGTRESFGHCEADLIFTKGSQAANVLTAVERKSRMIFLSKHESKQSAPIVASLKYMIGNIAKSCTFDNGKEFTEHHTLGILTYFCDPGAPWQKGGIENANNIIRRDVPFDMDPKSITQEYLDAAAYKMNNRPRKILGFLTPQEVFTKCVEQEKEQSRMKSAMPDVEAETVFYQKSLFVALHA